MSKFIEWVKSLPKWTLIPVVLAGGALALKLVWRLLFPPPAPRPPMAPPIDDTTAEKLRDELKKTQDETQKVIKDKYKKEIDEWEKKFGKRL